ncbi:PREDICTED: xanthine dehydrogenase-like [Polistes dominula]|uniref:Xanthine dehydrogenase-like n=1 Tax=Polistes dominula TaxID=743375 RepID=A0ABM1HT95_POLDO|nr:PREDICTED: xanthine dehydrogenase-like [Polistes dominula]
MDFILVDLPTEDDIISDSKSTVNLTINDVQYTVYESVPLDTSLYFFIREYAKLRGTKSMCLEGGCGACIVAATIKGQTMAVNSCLVPIYICDGWSIETIEGIGNRMKGYHPIQKTLAVMNGSQCGYCSPGMVMNLYSLLKDKKLTMKEIENSFGSNICRCTGYRPILDAFKSFASDAPPKLVETVQDIEESYKIKMCPKNGMPCKNGQICSPQNSRPISIKLEDSNFHKVLSIDNLFSIFQKYSNSTYILNGGNTAHGVYRIEKKDLYIDINDIPDLRRIEKTSNSLILGSNISLTVAMDTFEKYSKDDGFEYLRHLARHIDLIAHVPVRNIGTIAGNLMIKHEHHEFPSDLFLILQTAGASIHILESHGKKMEMNMSQFLKTNMRHKIIYSIVLPSLDSSYEFRSYKIMPRAQNAHALVNAGFLFKLDGNGNVVEKPNVLFGGIRPDFMHATHTENFLTHKCIFNKNVIKSALNMLDKELNPDHVLPDYSPEFRKTLAEGLFYKFILSIKSENIDSKLRSGGTILERELSSAKQDFETNTNTWPLNKPIAKMESIYQTSGEGQYVNDIMPLKDEVFCAFVSAEVASGTIKNIDASKALEMKGVVAFYTAKDIPGKNLFISSSSKMNLLSEDEMLFAEDKISFAGQPVGIIIATTHTIANEAVKKVKITFTDALKTKPIVTIDDALASNDKTRFLHRVNKQAKETGKDTKCVIKGTFTVGSQYHFSMETQTCVCVPTEDGMDVFAATQWMDLTQVSIAVCLGVQNNSININVRRLGGGYGSKLTRATQIACACALACYKLNRPVRFIMTIESNMMSIGKRVPAKQEYEVGVDDEGRIQYLNSTQWSNVGISFNEMTGIHLMHYLPNCYESDRWTCNGYEVKTDIPSNTWCRGPGSSEAIAMIENIMEHISMELKKDPIEVRLINMTEEDRKVMESMIEDLKKSSDYDSRKNAIEIFNSENRWKKKGIAFVPIKFPLVHFDQFNSMVSIYARDGTVSISHGGIEMGQGINTKVSQVAAYILGIDLELVKIKPTNNFIAPNNMFSGASITSEACAYATMMACKELLARLEPIKRELTNPTWQELVMTAYSKNVDLCARYMFTTKDITTYSSYGVSVAEVEIDVLTGQHILRRVDLLEDAGISFNPELDLGQVEGAFIMGIGYWTSEDLIYDPKTGALTNYRTWNYKPPGAKDIPVDFRVSLRRNSPNRFGVLRSKATGEPPLCMSVVISFAIRHALNSARLDAGKSGWYPLGGPVTTEKILLTSLTNKEQMVL